MSGNLSVRGVARVWRRFSMTLTRHLWGTLVNDLLGPSLQVLAYGFGIGSVVGAIVVAGMEVSYRAFVICGLVASSALWQGFFRGSYGAYMRMVYERLYKLIPSTPVTLDELVVGEMVWGATMGALGGLGALLIGLLTGDLSWHGVPLALLSAFLGGWLFTAVGLICAALAKDIHQLEYPINLVVMPLYLFSGVFFPLDLMPLWAQRLAEGLPLAAVVTLCRHALLATPLQPWSLVSGLLWWLGLSVVSVLLVRKKMER